MINVVAMAAHGNSFPEKCNRERMKLAFALFDVEIAHSRFVVLDAADLDHERCLSDLKSALAKYWEIDNQVERYLRRGDGRTSVDAPASPPMRSAFLAEPWSAITPGAKPIPRAAYREIANRGASRARPASLLLSAITRMVGYVGRKVTALTA